jgi:hypothetical protein
MDDLVGIIPARGIPSEIFRPVVIRDAIVMGPDHADRRRADECIQNKAVHPCPYVDATIAEADVDVPRFRCLQRQHAARVAPAIGKDPIKPPDPAAVRDLIETFEPTDRAPFFGCHGGPQ